MMKIPATPIIKSVAGIIVSDSQILDNHSFSMLRFTNSLKSLPFNKFLESSARS